ncbi:ABC transporter ATP-binding protein [Sulfurimonas marina]|uniref:ABC transporter ATP-binding protein n=1 Tax=Sulfurimonas marina TaxID=2590551 RepID=A0A7M1AXH4_9BACT|nr:ABC transporter ATP-binding protein [Sulfurimonas marina]QOP42167.1 ABC transporter ATP-binding protein [Sulfurimonas marina]
MSEKKNPPLIEFRKVKKVYGSGEATAYALKGIDLAIEKGEFVAIMGPSGSGKSTMMNIIGSLDVPSSGEYLFEGADVGSLDKDQLALLRRYYLGFVFQGFNLLAKTTALENVELPLIYKGIKPQERKKMALEALEKVGIAQVWEHTPGELSGGQQQRVAIARAIVTNPKILLADEPTGNLDTARSIEIMELLQKFNKEQGITVIMVTHEEDMASFAQRIIHFKDGLIENIKLNGKGKDVH